MERRSLGWRRVPVEEAVAQPPVREEEDPGPSPTRIENGCEIEGHLTLSGPLLVDGEFRGQITCRDDVTVTESGTVEAPITARNLIIRGAVVGDVEATREVVVAATGRLHGAVVTPSFVVERGGFFQGTTRMYRPEVTARRGDAIPPDLESPAERLRPPPGS